MLTTVDPTCDLGHPKKTSTGVRNILQSSCITVSQKCSAIFTRCIPFINCLVWTQETFLSTLFSQFETFLQWNQTLGNVSLGRRILCGSFSKGRRCIRRSCCSQWQISINGTCQSHLVLACSSPDRLSRVVMEAAIVIVILCCCCWR